MVQYATLLTFAAARKSLITTKCINKGITAASASQSDQVDMLPAEQKKKQTLKMKETESTRNHTPYTLESRTLFISHLQTDPYAVIVKLLFISISLPPSSLRGEKKRRMLKVFTFCFLKQLNSGERE